jgi:hypothetical protein
MRVWIAQCLCPQRHAICATSGKAKDVTDASELAVSLRAQVREMIDDGTINPWCGLCAAKAETWTYELGRTRFGSMQEAEPELRQSEREQAHVRRLFGDQ